MRRRALLAALAGAALDASAADPTLDQLAGFSLEQLSSLQVTSVLGRAERLSEAAASIYVITADEIRRSGAQRLPEALRLAPNLSVAQVTSAQYAISARGFNNTVGNKLLVLVDGRTIYTPMFSGVFWDQQHVMLEDVERIEVISGPGTTLWGANAVNGVINVITKKARDTQGALLAGAGGGLERQASLRYGGELGGGAHFRAYGTTYRHDGLNRPDGVVDDWRMSQAGFRADWGAPESKLTLQGDAYRGETSHRGFSGPTAIPPLEVSGANLLARWSRENADGTGMRLQAYYDHAKREDIALFSPDADIFDVEYQQRAHLQHHRLVWGAGYRRSTDEVGPGALIRFIPDERSLTWINAFVQDEIALAPSLDLTLGVKVERNSYTGWETLPSARLAWNPGVDKLAWAAVSRAIRAPARLDREIFLPASPPFLVQGGPDFQSEVAIVTEIGWRAQHANRVSYSITAYRYDWDRLRSVRVPGTIANEIEGFTSGVEAWGAWQAARSWRLSAGVTTLHQKLRLKPGRDPAGAANASLANDADYQWMLHSSHALGERTEFDVRVRRVGSLPSPSVPAYTAVDLRLGYRATQALEVALVVRNALDAQHVESGAPSSASMIERSALVTVAWRF